MIRRIIALLLALSLFAPWALADSMPEPVYSGIAQTTVRIRPEMSMDAEPVGIYQKESSVKILSYEPAWLEVIQGTEESWVRGYIPRHTVDNVTALKPDVLPYGALPATYTALVTRDVLLQRSPEDKTSPLTTVKKGARLAILSIENGWAKVLYWRQYGYLYVDNLTDLSPVYDVQSAESGDTIAAFISFYNTDEKELTQNRMKNIAQACYYISITMGLGDQLDFDGTAGPYRPARGYLEGMSYYEGVPAISTGGGVCQVSSTLYNVLLCLPEGMQILFRRAHGPSGATYLPHGVDAAVGNERLNLVFRNRFEFPVRIQAEAHEGTLFIEMIKEQVNE